jgi:hypothetical protein
MKHRREKIPGKDGYYDITDFGDFEYVNPIKQFGNQLMHMNASVLDTVSMMEFPDAVDDPARKNVVFRMAAEKASEGLNQYIDNARLHKFPQSLMNLLESKKKSRQEKAFRGPVLTSDQLMAFIFAAYVERGFKYSMYTSRDRKPELLDIRMPRLAIKEDTGEITVIGKTDLKIGEIKMAIEQNDLNIARFLDKGNIWHCFFYTMRGITGKETDGTPHIHYISNLWNIPRAEVVKQLKSKEYKLPSTPHIPFERYPE